jgi:hypothetical protein
VLRRLGLLHAAIVNRGAPACRHPRRTPAVGARRA